MSSVSVPLLDLTAQYQSLRDEITAVVTQVIESQRFILGPQVEGLEAEIAEYCQTKYCVGVSSGSDALLVALMALDIGPGDEVITTPYTFFATAGSIARLGAKPVFVDIDPASYNLVPEQISSQITERTKAIMPVHLFGQCADMDPINEIAEHYGLAVIEDAAQAIGAEYQGRRAGSLGTMGCFSFFPSKNLGAFGDGGAVTTSDPALVERLRSLRMHGSEQRYYHTFVGGNFRLDALQAAVLRVKLKYLDGWTSARQSNAEFYSRSLAEAGLIDSHVSTPVVVQDRHIFNQYVIQATGRDQLRQSLLDQQIGCEIYYPVPVHLQKCFAYLGFREGDFPISEHAALTTCALPIYPELTLEQKQAVVDAIAAYYQSAGLSRRQAA